MAQANRKLTTRQRESKKINRKRAVRQWWKVTSRCVMLACLALFLISCAIGGWFLWHSADKVAIAANNISAKFWQETAKLGFKVDSVYLEGRKFTSVADITKVLNVHSGDPILGLSLPDLRTNLQTIPRIKYAEVARVLPNQLHVNIVEREPVAIWQNEGKLHLIDDDGVVMEYIDPAQYKNLILVIGDDAPTHTQELFGMLAMEPEMYKDVMAALHIGQRRWNIRFKNGIELKLPEKNATEAWQSFASMERESHILERSIKTVDMRLSDRIFIKSTPTPAEVTPVKYSSGEI